MKEQEKQLVKIFIFFMMSNLLLACSKSPAPSQRDYSVSNTYLSSKYDVQFANADQDLPYNVMPRKMGEIYFYNCYLEPGQFPDIDKMEKRKGNLGLKYNTYLKINDDFMLINENHLSYKGVEYFSSSNEEKRIADICIKNLE